MALIAAVLDGGGVIPIDLHARAHALTLLAEELVGRGWELRDIDRTGLSLSWPDSLLRLEQLRPDMETPVTWLTLSFAGPMEYVLAGHVQGDPALGLWWTSNADFVDSLGRVEAYRHDDGT